MRTKRFFYSDSESLEIAFEIRRKVFVEEQKVEAYEEFDEFDKSSVHYLCAVDGIPVGTARWRITEQGVKLERFAVLKAYRSRGVGSKILLAIIPDCPAGNVYLHAQISAIDFYAKHGFEKVGELFTECNIEHYKMEYEHSRKMELRDVINFVSDFHKAFSLHMEDNPTAEVDDNLLKLRYELMKEENEEYMEAAKNADLVEIADALGDMLYILCGTILTHGMQHHIESVYREIQRSNMSKLDEYGKPIYREDGKVLKSDQYFKPDIKKMLEKK